MFFVGERLAPPNGMHIYNYTRRGGACSSRKKAPSGRELAAKQTEGERDGTIYHKAMVYAPMLHAISFRLATLDTSLPEGGYRYVVVAKRNRGY